MPALCECNRTTAIFFLAVAGVIDIVNSLQALGFTMQLAVFRLNT
jgi:hypothetical protein